VNQARSASKDVARLKRVTVWATQRWAASAADQVRLRNRPARLSYASRRHHSPSVHRFPRRALSGHSIGAASSLTRRPSKLPYC
jgi:hypothetical protein